MTTIVAARPYRVARNPIDPSFTLLSAGASVRAQALWAAALLPAVLIVMRHGMIVHKERSVDR